MIVKKPALRLSSVMILKFRYIIELHGAGAFSSHSDTGSLADLSISSAMPRSDLQLTQVSYRLTDLDETFGMSIRLLKSYHF